MKPALRTTITMLTRDLVTDPPVFYEDNPNGRDTWQCYLCFEEVPVVYDRPGHELACDYMNFPHSGTCLVVLVRHIEEMLEGEPE